MSGPSASRAQAVFVLAGPRTVALSIADVIETMRPLPVSAMPGLPAWARGVALIRGLPTPVLDLACLLGDEGDEPIGGFVTVRAGQRPVALAVQRVCGIAPLAPGEWQSLPSLAAGMPSAIDAVGVLAAQLVTVLHTGRLLPAEAWARLDAGLARHEGDPT